MKKKILMVHTSDIKDFPPVRNALMALLRNGHSVTLITKDATDSLDIIHRNFDKILLESSRKKFVVYDFFSHYRQRTHLRRIVKKAMATHDILWTTTDTTVRELGDLVLEYRHVMQILELIKCLPLFPYQSFINFDIKKYAQAAWKVVVPEYNRAHIQKVWWNLDKLPVVLPNKTYLPKTYDELSNDIMPIVNEMKLEERMVVLYQGVFEDDRNLEPYAEAISHLDEEFCLYIMGKDNDIRERLCRRFPKIKYIPFIIPPNHLYVTRFAKIGLLSYRPVKIFHYSELNALFCAPNKIYEYAAFSLPMIGSDVPGLAFPFKYYNIGCVCNEEVKDICETLKIISKNYEFYKNNCLKFYSDVNIDKVVNDIILT